MYILCLHVQLIVKCCARCLYLCCLWLLLCVTGLDEHPVETPVTVEGGFSVWFKTRQYHYFTLMSQVTDRCRKLDQYLEQPTQFDDDGKLLKRHNDGAGQPQIDV